MIQSKSTQEFVPVREIRDGVVMLKDKNMCSVLMASSLNFALKSEDEQSAIILQYQNFLNSLDFPLQFFIQSKELEIEPYIATLEEAHKQQPNELLKIQIREYVEFIKNFVKSTNIVSKTFYVVIPYAAPVFSSPSGNPLVESLKFFRQKEKKQKEESADAQFEEAKSQIEQRVSVVSDGLVRLGVRTAALNTEELIELFYKLFNPGESEKAVLEAYKESA